MCVTDCTQLRAISASPSPASLVPCLGALAVLLLALLGILVLLAVSMHHARPQGLASHDGGSGGAKGSPRLQFRLYFPKPPHTGVEYRAAKSKDGYNFVVRADTQFGSLAAVDV